MKFIGFAALLAMAAVAHAQEHQCAANETFGQCSDRLLGQAAALVATKEAEATAAATEVPAGVRAKNTGDPINQTINDFLPLLRAFLDTGDGSGKDGGKIGFKWSNPLGLPAEHQNKVTIGLVRSQMYEPLRARCAQLRSKTRSGASRTGSTTATIFLSASATGPHPNDMDGILVCTRRCSRR